MNNVSHGVAAQGTEEREERRKRKLELDTHRIMKAIRSREEYGRRRRKNP